MVLLLCPLQKEGRGEVGKEIVENFVQLVGEKLGWGKGSVHDLW
jgi:hypothetical protein